MGASAAVTQNNRRRRRAIVKQMTVGMPPVARHMDTGLPIPVMATKVAIHVLRCR